MSKNIFIIRHCKADGQSPSAALTDEGIVQAKELGNFLSDLQVEYIVSSPFKRAIQTIQPFAVERDIKVVLDNRLSERVLSSESLPGWLEKLEATFQDMDLKYEGGESSNEAKNRIVNVVDDIVAGNLDNAVIVAHGGIISLLLHHYDENFSFEQWKGLSNPDVYLISFSEDDYYVKRLWNNE